MILPIENKAAREILYYRIKTSKDKEKANNMKAAWAEGLIPLVLTDYKEMLKILSVEDFLSVVPIKEHKRRNK